MKSLLLALLLLGASCSSPTVDLFNGSDLDGWHTDIPAADNNADLKPSFSVRDGMLISNGTPQGHLITDAIYQN